MNRRQFLQALAALGASVSIPVVLQSASAAQVDEAWATALADPWCFEVERLRHDRRAGRAGAQDPRPTCSTSGIGSHAIPST